MNRHASTFLTLETVETSFYAQLDKTRYLLLIENNSCVTLSVTQTSDDNLCLITLQITWTHFVRISITKGYKRLQIIAFALDLPAFLVPIQKK
jgi:hypothetical protein